MTSDHVQAGRRHNGLPWFGIGIERCKREVNLGTLWRSAVCFGASFVFTIGHRYERQASDTVGAPYCVPFFAYQDLDDFNDHRPYGGPLVGVELAPNARPLETFVHPRRALYLLGPEDGSLSLRAQALCQEIVAFDSRWCLNVATAGSVVLYDRQMKAALNRRSADVAS